jgi:hypothetical protein
MSEKLKFSRTISITAFAKANTIGNVELLRNEKTNKTFFSSDAGISGKVSTKVSTLDASLMVSVCTDDSNESFYMLHPKGEGGATKLGSMDFAL